MFDSLSSFKKMNLEHQSHSSDVVDLLVHILETSINQCTNSRDFHPRKRQRAKMSRIDRETLVKDTRTSRERAAAASTEALPILTRA
jgi:hypothetical protein